MQLLQNIGRRHLYEEDTYNSVFADGLMPLECLDKAVMQGEAYLAVIDRWSGKIQEVLGSELSLEASFGGVTYDGETLAVTKPSGESQKRGREEGPTVCFAVIDRRTGDVVLMRSYSL